ncbi:MAG: YncE family protein [bacterium]|nr:YncE family protein [bacterium]
MKVNLSIGLLLSLATASSAVQAVPAYHLDGFLDAPICTSVDLSPDRSTVYARAHFGSFDEGYRAFEATPTYEHIRDYPVEGSPWAGRVSADGQHIWTTRYYPGDVAKMNLTTGNLDASLPLGSWTTGLEFDSQRRYLYVGENHPGTGAMGSIHKIDTFTDSVVGIPAPVNGEPGHHIVVSPDDAYVYTITDNTTPKRLHKIRTSDMQVVDTHDLSGSENHVGFSLSPDGSVAYVPEASGDKVHLIDTATMDELDFWSLPDAKGFFVSPDGTHALVLNDGPGIRVFDLASQSVDFIEDDLLILTGWARGTPYWDDTSGRVYVPQDGFNGGVAVLVPEPATLSLLALGGLAAVCRRHARRMRP